MNLALWKVVNTRKVLLFDCCCLSVTKCRFSNSFSRLLMTVMWIPSSLSDCVFQSLFVHLQKQEIYNISYILLSCLRSLISCCKHVFSFSKQIVREITWNKAEQRSSFEKKPKALVVWFIIYKSITVCAAMVSKTRLEIASLPLNPVLCCFS